MQEQTLFNVDIKKKKMNIIQRPPKVLDFGLGKFRWTAKDTIGNLEKMTQTELWKLADQNSDQRSVVTGPTWSEMGHITGSPLFTKDEISVSFHQLLFTHFTELYRYSVFIILVWMGYESTTLRFTNGPMLAQKLTSNWSSRKVCAVRCDVPRNHWVASHNPTNDQVTRGSLRTSPLDQIHYT